MIHDFHKPKRESRTKTEQSTGCFGPESPIWHERPLSGVPSVVGTVGIEGCKHPAMMTGCVEPHIADRGPI